MLGNGLFLPLTQEYASKEVRVGDVISRISQIPRFLDQAKSVLVDADPIFISTAIEENDGNIDLVDSVAADIPAGSPLKAKYDKAAPAAKKALTDFTAWMQNDLAKQPTNGRTWRLGAEWYAPKFHYVIETSIQPDQLLADAEAELKTVRAEMLQIALPLYKQMYPGQDDYSSLPAGGAREQNHRRRAEQDWRGASAARSADRSREGRPRGIPQFIREKKIVTLSSRDNLKVIPTPEFERGIYSVAGFHGAPPLEPPPKRNTGSRPSIPRCRRQGREQAARVQQLHAEVADHPRGVARPLRAGRACR